MHSSVEIRSKYRGTHDALQVIRPMIHERPALAEVLRVVVSSADAGALGVGELQLNMLVLKALLMQDC